MSRPSSFTQETADAICERLADGESLRSICLDDWMPARSVVFKWLASNDAFADQYARAREEQAEKYLDEIIEIADDGSNDTYETEDGQRKTDWDVIGRSKLRVDARKWAMSKLAPKKYGEKQSIEHSVSDDTATRILEARRRARGG